MSRFVRHKCCCCHVILAVSAYHLPVEVRCALTQPCACFSTRYACGLIGSGHRMAFQLEWSREIWYRRFCLDLKRSRLLCLPAFVEHNFSDSNCVASVRGFNEMLCSGVGSREVLIMIQPSSTSSSPGTGISSSPASAGVSVVGLSRDKST